MNAGGHSKIVVRGTVVRITAIVAQAFFALSTFQELGIVEMTRKITILYGNTVEPIQGGSHG